MFYNEEDYWAHQDERAGIGAPLYTVGSVPCHSYDEAIRVSGADHPDDIAAEERAETTKHLISTLRAPVFCGWCLTDPELPF